ncbi:hypothetical protein BegalDRAFT_0004 [Beggiatoa alba B18LD]|uniref:Uncharacterized protein n=1 Tax=Beggiatoa alba B18LD TaxID=395493 RepID=I3CL78_9GAMM|nr:transposase [Beggiatoa alba]EIJ44371.1 hypothetical protein BegalDRAFT_0004 [Beggiatoa alba B18LD]
MDIDIEEFGDYLGVVCPYCGYKDTDIYEKESHEVYQCPSCKKEYVFKVSIVFFFKGEAKNHDNNK